MQAALDINTLCPNCEGDEKAQEAWSIFEALHNEQQQQEPDFEDEDEVDDVEVFNCMLCGAPTANLTMHTRVVNGEWVTEHLPFCSAMHHAIYSLNLPH